MRNRITLFLLPILVTLGWAAAVFAAAPPSLINYQGVLRDALGQPLTGSYDITFRLHDAPAGGSELLVDQHRASNGQAVVVANGVFSAQIGGGAVMDGSGPGVYVSTLDVFRGHGAVWMQVEVEGEVLAPRLRVAAAAYALNAGAVEGKAADTLLDTSATLQVKTGRLIVGKTDPVTSGEFGIEAEGGWAGAYFTSSEYDAEFVAPYGDTGLFAQGDDAGGYFQNPAGSYALLATPSYGLYAGGEVSGSYFHNAVGNGFAELARANSGIEAHGSGLGGLFRETDTNSTMIAATNGYGLQAVGGTAGGQFDDYNGTGFAELAKADTGIEAQGSGLGGLFRETDTNSTMIAASGGYGLLAVGDNAGGQFDDYNGTGFAELAKADTGIEARGSFAAGYFVESDQSAYTWVALSGWGVYTYAPAGGAWFDTSAGTGSARLAYGDEGIYSTGTFGGGFFDDTDSSAFARVGYASYKIQGSGAVSFVQNHPHDASKVIVYAAPEGDEVAVYTRGSARLHGGLARVALGDTFALVANPDVGLTAHLTPRGEAADLFVESIDTGELIVRGPAGSSAEFDYIVWGLRIGFEEQSIVQPKQVEAPIPSMADHEAIYAKEPALRGHSALARHRVMARDVRGAEDIDLSRSEQLIAAIGRYDWATSVPVEAMLGRRAAPGPTGVPAVVTSEKPGAEPVASDAAATILAADTHATPVAAGTVPFDVFRSADALRTGDVVVLDPQQTGMVRLSVGAGDPLVVGCVVDPPTDAPALAGGDVAVAASRIALCRADATEHPIGIGDLLVVAASPGHATRAVDPAPGQLLGKALEPLDSGTGLIRVLVGSR